MSGFQGNKIAAKMFRAHRKYRECVESLELYLHDKIEFEFGIDHQPSDGHMVLDVESGMLIAPLAECLSVIYTKGSLSKEDHKKLCI